MGKQKLFLTTLFACSLVSCASDTTSRLVYVDFNASTQTSIPCGGFLNAFPSHVLDTLDVSGEVVDSLLALNDYVEAEHFSTRGILQLPNSTICVNGESLVVVNDSVFSNPQLNQYLEAKIVSRNE